MVDREKILQVVFEAVDALNDLLPEDRQLAKSLDTALFGGEGTLSSLNLVNLIVETERQVEMVFGSPISLADERAMSQKHNPFGTVNVLVDYIALLLEESS